MRAADNPFAVHRVLRERYRLTDAEWTQLLDRLASLRHRAAIVGAKGSGKTTLLEDLGARLEARGWRIRWVRLHSDARTLPPLQRLARDEIVLCDGAEQLTRWGWWRLRARTVGAGGLVVTSHRAGLLPTLRRCETSPALLHDLVESLGVAVAAARCAELWAASRGNVRDALRALYDEAAEDERDSRSSPGDRGAGTLGQWMNARPPVISMR